MEGERRRARSEEITYCVTGASGYIGSWLVRSLLQSGYRVHATVRDPEKALHLLPLWGGADRLRLLKADLQEEGSFDDAVKDCNGVFHVAASMELSVMELENVDDYVRTKIIEPSIKGTLNLLKACLKSKCMKRVVFTSSISTITAKDNAGLWRAMVDESCRIPIEHTWNTKACGWNYALSKLLTEEAAFKFATENGIDLVAVITPTVAGPFLNQTIPSSIQFLLSPITGDKKFYPLLCAVNSRIGSTLLIHIEDICNVHRFLMEHTEAEGQYLCCGGSSLMPELLDHLAQEYPCSNITRLLNTEKGKIPSEISTKRLSELGFTYKYGLQDIIRETITFCVEHGFLPPIRKT